MDIIEIISQKTGRKSSHVAALCRLLFEESATIPFVSRYRKEATGGMDEVTIGDIAATYRALTELEKRKTTVREAIDAAGALTDDMARRIEACTDPKELEDLYLPYRPKRRTRASAAREKGLEPLAAMIMKGADPRQASARFTGPKVGTEDEALAGASDIIAEWASENVRVRRSVRRIFTTKGVMTSKVVAGKEREGAKYSDYFDFSEPLKRIPAHRFLALMRAADEGVIKMGVQVDDAEVLNTMTQTFAPGLRQSAASFVDDAVRDGYKRLLRPSIENETIAEVKQRADGESIRVFGDNLRQLLLSPPLGACRVLAIDPGFRTGCKVVCLDSDGTLLHNDTIYPHPPQNELQTAVAKLRSLIERYRCQAVAVGDGTAGRETERMLKEMKLPEDIRLFMVSEDGASVYSASPVAREEFPDHDVTVRGSVSIGRRLIDPLSELVKIDPKSIGVGQYQHDVDQARLKESLDSVVSSCVNNVGVDLNTASRHLLRYVSGIGESLAAAIVDYRSQNGPFKSRRQLKEVPRLGAKAFEQCAGFMRIPGAANPLDNSAVHPESYPVVERMAGDLGVDTATLVADKSLQAKIVPQNYVTDKTGMPTIVDIMAELAKPGRDPRDKIEVFEFADGLHSIEDLAEGMEVPGIVTNITAFGAFVDIGVKQDGLVHISQLADRYISDPSTVVRLHQHVKVRILSVDRSRGRIQLKKI